MKNPFSAFLTPRGPTVKAIQALLQRIGAPTSGQKDVLQRRLFQEAGLQTSVFGSPGISKRILSIDMGIKNLAYCVADVTGPNPSNPIQMQVTQWDRLDLTDQTLQGDIKRAMRVDAAAQVDGDEADMFAPQSLANTAYWLVQNHFLQYQPDIILIERQRWRSSSSSAIQQWTVRVNSLEAMLWAALTTLSVERWNLPDDQSAGRTKPFTLYAADPKRVGMFWLDAESAVATKLGKTAAMVEEDLEEDVEEEEDESQTATRVAAPKKLSRTKAEKKAKIQLLRTWLNHEKPSTSLSATQEVAKDELIHRPVINFEFPAPRRAALSNAKTTQQLFLWMTDSPAEKRTRKSPKPESKTKVDDLTDCFLQATTYVAWMANRVELKKHLERFTADAEKPAETSPKKDRAKQGIGCKAELTVGEPKSKGLKTRKKTSGKKDC